MKPILFRCLVSVSLLAAGPATASGLETACNRAAQTAASETGVPLRLLLAIALVESGRTGQGPPVSWPWTANIAGESHYFPTGNEAVLALSEAVANGEDRIDVGCFQLNLVWHGDRFRSLQSMIDPVANARYAARYLLTLHEEFGSWDGAVGAYHSRDPDRASDYRGRVLAALDQVPESGPPPVVDPTGLTSLIIGGGRTTALGSLVPSGATAHGPLITGIGG